MASSSAFGWRDAMLVTGAIVGAAVILATLPARNAEVTRMAERNRPWAFWLLFLIHIGDSSVRSGVLIYLPFLLRAKAADLPTIGFGLSPLFAGGAAGKLVMGWIDARLGVVASVVPTEVATTALSLAILLLSLTASLTLLP